MCAVEYTEYYTYEDYKHWKGDWELIQGIPYAMAPAPMRKHQNIASELIFTLREQIENCLRCEVLGEVDYKVGEDTILRPDVVLTCDESGETYLTKTPEIIVEIISKSTIKRDEKYKFEIYEAQKVNYYILVYPDELKAKIYKLDDDKYEKQGDFRVESYHFKNTLCDIKIDFERLFKRFRK